MHSRIEPSGCAQSGVLTRSMGAGILILLVGLLFVGGASATTIFSDDFETGDFSKWSYNHQNRFTIVSSEKGLSANVVSTPAYIERDSLSIPIDWEYSYYIRLTSDGLYFVDSYLANPSAGHVELDLCNSTDVSACYDYSTSTNHQYNTGLIRYRSTTASNVYDAFTLNLSDYIDANRWVKIGVAKSGNNVYTKINNNIIHTTVMVNPHQNIVDGLLSLFDIDANGDATGILFDDVVLCSGSCAPPTVTPPAPTNLAQTNDSASYVNWTWQAGTGNVTDSFNVSVNGSWTNGSADLFYNHTGITYSSWSNISVFAYNSSGTGTLNTTEVSGSVQLPQQIITISCPAAGWCYLASNYSSKTLLELDNLFSTDTIQGFYGNVSKKYVSHRTGYKFNENQSVSEGQGYYYYFTSAQDVTITIPDLYSIDLVTGWNLVSNFGANRTLSALETSITNVTAKQRYNAATKTWVDDDLDTVKQGESFFAYVSANTTWTS